MKFKKANLPKVLPALVVFILSGLTVQQVVAQQNESGSAFDKLKESVREREKHLPVLPEQETFALAQEALDSVDLNIRVRWYKARSGSEFVDAGRVSGVESWGIRVVSGGLEIPTGFSAIYRDGSEIGTFPVETDVSIPSGNDLFAIAENGPTEVKPSLSFYELDIQPKTLKASTIHFKMATDRQEPTLITLSAYEDPKRAQWPYRLTSNLTLIYASEAGTVSLKKRHGHDIKLEFPGKGLHWMHCFGRDYRSTDNTCRIIDPKRPVYLTLWKLSKEKNDSKNTSQPLALAN